MHNTYALCLNTGEVVTSIKPQEMTIQEANKQNKDFHIKGIGLVWIETTRIENGKVTR